MERSTINTKLHSNVNCVDFVGGSLTYYQCTPASPPPCRLVTILNAAWYSKTIIVLALFFIIGSTHLSYAYEDVETLIKEKRFDELAKLGEAAIDPLIDTLKDKDWKVREDAINTLGKIGAPAVDPLIDDLRLKFNNYRWDTALALGKIGTPAVEPIISALKYKNRHVRRYGAMALGHIKDPRAVEPLIALLKKKDKRLREQAARALGKIGDARARDALVKALKDKEENVRRHSALALGEIGGEKVSERLISALEDESWLVRRDAAIALGKLKEAAAVEPLIASFKDDESWVRDDAARALGKIGAPAVEPLISALQADKEVVKKHAIKALGKIKDPRAEKPLISMAGDEESKVRKEAACAIGEINGEKAIESLVAMLDETDLGITYCVTYSLSRISAPAVEPLIFELQKGSVSQQKVANLLGIIGDKRAVEPLLGLMDVKTTSIRRAAVKALGMIEDAGTIDKIASKLDDADEFVRYYAADALNNLDWKPSGQSENIKYLLAGQDFKELIKLNEPAVNPLIDALEDISPNFRVRAALALGEIGDTKAIEPLIAILSDDENSVKDGAGSALKMITKEDFGSDKDKWQDWFDKSAN